MRISTSQIFTSGLNGILDGQAKTFALQNQISSGKRVASPGDDPVAASRIGAVNNQLAVLEQYQKNADVAESRLQLEEDTLATIKNSLDRVRELAIQAGDGALAQTERQGIAVEIEQRIDQLLGLVNTRDINNQYLFAGFQSRTIPFEATSGGGYSFAGDEGQLFIQISESLDVAVSDSGKGIFVDVDEPLNFSAVANAGNTGAAVVNNQAVTSQAEFEAFHPEGATVTFSVAAGVTSYTVRQVSSGTVLDGGDPVQPLLNIPYVQGEPIEFNGVHLNISGAPDNGDTIDVSSDPAGKLDMLSMVQRLQQELETLGDSPADNLRQEELIADTLIGIDNVLSKVSGTQAEIGARLNSIDGVRDLLADRELISRDVLSRLEDLDYAEALSNLTQQSFILEASQQTFVRVSNLNLFNFL